MQKSVQWGGDIPIKQLFSQETGASRVSGDTSDTSTDGAHPVPKSKPRPHTNADEDSEVTDAKLAEHLAHWGINMMVMEKTEQSVAELNIAANEKFTLDSITEAGRELVPVSGPGHVGLANLGNSCYVNSVMQMLFAMPEYAVIAEAATSLFGSAGADPSDDLLAQLAKLANALVLGADLAGKAENDEGAVRPRMLRRQLQRQ